MADDQIRSDMEALMTPLVQTERALMDTRQHVAAAPKAAALLVDTRTIGKDPTFTGEHKDWPEWSFQFTAYMGSAIRCAALQWQMARSQPQRPCNRVVRAQCSNVHGFGTEEHSSQQRT